MRSYTAQELHDRLNTYKMIQGPLAGVSSVPFRELIWRYSTPAWVCSEMTSCKTILYGSEHIKRRYLSIGEQEGPLCLQIATSDPLECAKACAEINKYPISVVDLNAGCPVKKIRKRGQGSSLLDKPFLLKDIICAMRDHSNIAISVKIRVHVDDDAKNEALLDTINRANPDFLVVHGRSYTDTYDVACRHDKLSYFTTHAKMPVIGNGDCFNYDSAKAMLDLGMDGVMISRASVGQPWCIQRIHEQMGILPYASKLNQDEAWRVFQEHIRSLSRFFKNDRVAHEQAKGLIKYYARHNNFDKQVIKRVHADLSYLY